MTLHQKALESASYINNQVTGLAEVAIILGSGLGSFTQNLKNQIRIPYASIPHFPVSTVAGHSGELIFGELNGIKLWVMSGRFHYYESYSLSETVYPLWVLKCLSVGKLIISNASGGLNPDFEPGDLMLITDYIDLFSDNPLRGNEVLDFGPKFPDMSNAFDAELQSAAKHKAIELSISLRDGIYIGVKGPSLETKAEIKYLRFIGGDAVGMSTVPEVIAANQMGLKVLGFSVITNQCSPQIPKEFTHEEVVSVANKAGGNLVRLVEKMLEYLSEIH